MNKKAIAILGAIFLLIVGTLGFLIYMKYKNQNPKTDNQNSQNNSSNSTPQPTVSPTPTVSPAPTKTVSRLTEMQVVSPIINYEGNAITYLDNQGRIYESKFLESEQGLSLAAPASLEVESRANISRVLWPQHGHNFILEFNRFGKKSWSFYNFETGAYTDLPAQVAAVAWLPSSDKIAYIWLENGKATLNVSNPDTSDWKQISEMWELDNDIHISPDGTHVLYFRTENTGSQNAINLTTLDGKTWKGLVKEGYNFGALWSPDGQKFLFSRKDSGSQRHQLYVYDVTSGQSKNTGLFSTPQKAVWDRSSKYAYLAASVSGSPEAGSLSSDIFYRVDASTLDTKAFDSGEQKVDGRDLLLDNSGSRLFFRNAQDGSLYYLNLAQ